MAGASSSEAGQTTAGSTGRTEEEERRKEVCSVILIQTYDTLVNSSLYKPSQRTNSALVFPPEGIER